MRLAQVALAYVSSCTGAMKSGAEIARKEGLTHAVVNVLLRLTLLGAIQSDVELFSAYQPNVGEPT